MLDSLHIQNFRCFEDLTIPSLGRVNLIVGKNSVGKSSLLEAIYILSQDGMDEAIQDVLQSRHEVFEKDFNIKSIFHKQLPPENNSIFIGNDSIGTKVYWPSNRPPAPLIRQTIAPAQVVTTSLRHENLLAGLWDKIVLNDDDQQIKDALKIITPEIVNLVFVNNPKADSSNQWKIDRVAIVKLKNEAQGIPLKSFGEGMTRLLQIFAHAFEAKGGFLLVDEFENGLHYSIQEEVWEKLFRLAKKLDIQVFATTHSLDTIRTFNKIALSHPGEEQLISLGHSAASSDNGKITATSFNESELRLFLESEMEVR